MPSTASSGMTGHGEMTVKRTCAVPNCPHLIEAPARFCEGHWIETPHALREECKAHATEESRRPAVQAIVDWWSERDA